MGESGRARASNPGFLVSALVLSRLTSQRGERGLRHSALQGTGLAYRNCVVCATSHEHVATTWVNLKTLCEVKEARSEDCVLCSYDSVYMKSPERADLYRETAGW